MTKGGPPTRVRPWRRATCTHWHAYACTRPRATHLRCTARASRLRRLRATLARSIKKRTAVWRPDRMDR